MSLKKWSKNGISKAEEAHRDGKKKQFPRDPIAAGQQTYNP